MRACPRGECSNAVVSVDDDAEPRDVRCAADHHFCYRCSFDGGHEPATCSQLKRCAARARPCARPCRTRAPHARTVVTGMGATAGAQVGGAERERGRQCHLDAGAPCLAGRSVPVAGVTCVRGAGEYEAVPGVHTQH